MTSVQKLPELAFVKKAIGSVRKQLNYINTGQFGWITSKEMETALTEALSALQELNRMVQMYRNDMGIPPAYFGAVEGLFRSIDHNDAVEFLQSLRRQRSVIEQTIAAKYPDDYEFGHTAKWWKNALSDPTVAKYAPSEFQGLPAGFVVEAITLFETFDNWDEPAQRASLERMNQWIEAARMMAKEKNERQKHTS